jgi:hypothetical protein
VSSVFTPQEQHASQSLGTDLDGASVCGVPTTASLDFGAQHAEFTVSEILKFYRQSTGKNTGLDSLDSSRESGSVIVLERKHLEEKIRTRMGPTHC